MVGRTLVEVAAEVELEISARLGGRALVLMPFGSHLYGTDTERSDFDFKGVFVPSDEEAMLGRIPHSVRSERRKKMKGEKNDPGEVEWEMLSLHRFLELAVEGQTMALDLLHALPGAWTFGSEAWMDLHRNRRRFHTKSLQAFVGYARRQASKYGIKGSRLACARAWLDLFRSYDHDGCEAFRSMTVSALASRVLPSSRNFWEHAKWTDDPEVPLEILGRRLTGRALVAHYIPMLERFVENYGERARQAESDQGIDWKAMSHALRAAISVERILLVGDFWLPFDRESAGYLLKVKLGRMPFRDVQVDLEERIERIERIAEGSSLPEHADKEWANDFLLATMKRMFRRGSLR